MAQHLRTVDEHSFFKQINAVIFLFSLEIKLTAAPNDKRTFCVAGVVSRENQEEMAKSISA